MARPRLLDLFCGAGGAGMGYRRAGFDVTGVDIAPQPRYPFAFVEGDALAYVAAHGHEYDAIHASPPCQAHSITAAIWRREHPDLIPATRAALVTAGRPYIIENVVGAPLHQPVMLCGTMFGLRVYRHRLFEMNWFLLVPPHGRHRAPCAEVGRRPLPHEWITVAGHFADLAAARRAMGIDWMTRDELSQAIPPAYAEIIGAALLRHLAERAAVA